MKRAPGSLIWAVPAGMVAIVLLLGLLLGAGPDPPRGADRLLDVSQDVVIDRAFVPSADRRQGEVRIVRRGARVVVQTLLYSKVLPRVVGAISEKERRNWPPREKGHSDMERYLKALSDAAHLVAARSRDGEAKTDRRSKLWIEFAETEGRGWIALGGMEIAEHAGEVKVIERRHLTVLDVGLGYVRRNMRLIISDAFGISDAEAGNRVARASLP